MTLDGQGCGIWFDARESTWPIAIYHKIPTKQLLVHCRTLLLPNNLHCTAILYTIAWTQNVLAVTQFMRIIHTPEQREFDKTSSSSPISLKWKYDEEVSQFLKKHSLFLKRYRRWESKNFEEKGFPQRFSAVFDNRSSELQYWLTESFLSACISLKIIEGSKINLSLARYYTCMPRITGANLILTS